MNGTAVAMEDRVAEVKAATPASPAWAHQIEALDFVRDKPGAMLAMAMGTGKSRVAIDLIEDHDCERTLVLAPKSVVSYVWPEQIALHSRRNYRVVTLDQSSTALKRDAAMRVMSNGHGLPLVVLVNYESAWREPLGSWLRQQQWNLLVMDELHRIKSPGGVASRFCSRLADRIPQRLGLTGTPMPHSPLDIYAQYRALDKRVFGTSNHRFRSRYAVIGGYSGREVVGYQNLGELEERFRGIAYQVSAEEALELPPTNDVHHTVEMGAKGRRIYGGMERDFLADLGEGRIATAANALARLLRLQQITSGFTSTEDGDLVAIDDSKANHLGDVLEDLPRDEPVVVFARFRADLDVIVETARRGGRGAFEVSGRAKQLEEWRAGGGVLAVQIQAGGLGLDLSMARYCIYYSLGFSLGDYLQSRARLHRPGQRHPVSYLHIVATDSVDEKVIDSLQRKEDVIGEILRTKRL